MSETRITDNGTDVTYTMPPYIADDLAAILDHWATHKADGSLRKPAKYDRGWIEDAENLGSAALSVTEDADAEG